MTSQNLLCKNRENKPFSKYSNQNFQTELTSGVAHAISRVVQRVAGSELYIYLEQELQSFGLREKRTEDGGH
jgi:hypothetical protein